MFKIGIIGCGKIAQVRHIPEYLGNPEAELFGFYDLNHERAKQLAERYHAKYYENLDDLFSDSEIDAVSICTANETHAAISIAALKAQKHVLCEKPMAVNMEECEAMIKAAKENKKFLMIGQNQRLARAHILAKELIGSNLIGNIITFRSTFGHSGPETWSIDSGNTSWFFDKKRAVMGAMADLGIHKTDLIRFLLNQDIVKTTAKITTLDKKDSEGKLISVDDNAICIYEMSGGACGVVTASWSYYGEEDNSTILYGTNGIMEIYDDPNHSIIVKMANGEKRFYDVEKIQSNDNQTKSGIIDLWLDCLANHREPEISGESVFNSMKAVFGSIDSSITGKTVTII